MMIDVRVCSAEPGMALPWNDLVRRGSPNVFMDPAALKAAHATDFAKLRVLCAWAWGEGPETLVGVWALQERSLLPIWPKFLSALPYNYALASDPVIDTAYVDAVMPAFLSAIRQHRGLPNVVRLSDFDRRSPAYAALEGALGHSGSRIGLVERNRPFVTREAGQKLTGSTRKKIRQDWNRLTAVGALAVENAQSPDGVRAALETFLAMERASWKGAKGTALLCDPKDAAFTRALIGSLAAEQKASVALLTLDGQAIAAQVLLRCHDTAYTWKTSFDAAYAKYSPGVLLVDKITEQLFAGGTVTAIDSCSRESGFMGALWSGRRTTVDCLIDVGSRRSFAFDMIAAGERGYSFAKAIRDKVRSAGWLSPMRRKGLWAFGRRETPKRAAGQT